MFSSRFTYRLAKVFGSTPETWFGMQTAFDLARSRHLEKILKIDRVHAAWRRSQACRRGLVAVASFPVSTYGRMP